MRSVLLTADPAAGDVVVLAVTRADGTTLAAPIARRVAQRAAELADVLARSGYAFTIETTLDRFGLTVTDGPEEYALPAGAKRTPTGVEFPGKVADDPVVVPPPDEFPDVLPGSSGPLAAAVQLFVGRPITGYLDAEDAAAIAEVNEALGLEYADAFTTATARALADHLAPRRSTKGKTK